MLADIKSIIPVTYNTLSGMDTVTKERRSEIMRLIGPKDTAPELSVCRILKEMGMVFACHVSTLPGKPDIVIPQYRTVVFVHGCFWHGHSCPRGKRPATRKIFWNDKLDKNTRRDRRVKRALWADGWHVITVWECQIKHADTIRRKLNQIQNIHHG
jgi:DNA mismatch endonuclease, patch repair protein